MPLASTQVTDAHRLLELLDEPLVQLDRVAAIIGGLTHSDPSEDWVVEQLDSLTVGLTQGADTEEAIAHVFGTLGFRGNTKDYYDPDNSRVQMVLERRVGVPLTLAVVAIEIARRVGVQLLPVGMPGHFLLAESPTPALRRDQIADGPGTRPSRFFDPFSGGRELDAQGCQRVFEQLMSEQAFDPLMLRPVGPVSVAARMLQNLRVVYLRQGDVSNLAGVLRLRVELPGSSHTERLEYSNILGALGRFDQAADQRDLLATLQPDQAKTHLAAAKRHRARRN